MAINRVRAGLLATSIIALLLMSTGCFQIVDQETYGVVTNPNTTAFTGSPNKFISIITGAYAGERFGASVIPFSDVDGAGHPGIAVGAIASSPFQKPGCGSVYVISFVNLQTRYRLDGQAKDDQFGTTMAMIGDLDNDKVSDFIVGAPLGDVEGLTDAGYAIVYSGNSGKQLEYFTGTENFFRLGHSLAGLGDVNQDNIPDFAIGSPYARGSGKDYTGVVFLELSGQNPLNYQPLMLYGEEAGDNFGWSVVAIGDINGDRIPDIAVGAPGAKSSDGASVGRVYILSGNGGNVLYKVDGIAPGERFGFSVIGIGDIDSDKVPDFTVGAPVIDLATMTPHGLEKAGKAYVCSGKNGKRLFTLEGLPQGYLFGNSLASGDVNSDGISDIMVGDPSAGQKHGAVHVFSGKDGSKLYVFINNPVRKDEIGFALNCGNDINKDGRPDVIVGAYGAPNIEGKPTGMVFILNIP
jgi:hypothetical protein